MISQAENELESYRYAKRKLATNQKIDSWHTDPGLSKLEAQEGLVIQRLQNLQKDLPKLQVLKDLVSDGLVAVGKKVTLLLTSTIIPEPEELSVILVEKRPETHFSTEAEEDSLQISIDNLPEETDDDFLEISINSPLGAAILGKKVNGQASYRVEKNQFFAKILAIL